MSQDKFTLWISLVSLALSMSTWVRTFIAEHRRLRFSIQLLQAKDGTAYMRLVIENKSRLPIAISKITLLQKRSSSHLGKICFGYNRTDCAFFPKEVVIRVKRIHGKYEDLPPIYSESLPISLDGLSSKSCIVLFEDIPEAIPQTATHLTLEILTNRGMTTRKKLRLPTEWVSHNDIL